MVMVGYQQVSLVACARETSQPSALLNRWLQRARPGPHVSETRWLRIRLNFEMGEGLLRATVSGADVRGQAAPGTQPEVPEGLLLPAWELEGSLCWTGRVLPSQTPKLN